MEVAANGPEEGTTAGPVPSAWVRLAGGIGVATDPRKLSLAAVGLILLMAGWLGLARLFPGDPGFGRSVLVAGPVAGSPDGWLNYLAGRVAEPALSLMGPFLALFATGRGTGSFLHAALAAFWAALVWGIIGGAIARIAVVQLATGERIGVLTALRFAARKGVSLVGSPLSPFVGVALLTLPCAVLGFLLYQIPGPVGAAIAGALAFVPLLIGVVLALVLLGLAAGWPLMIATVAADGEDGFDALSRSYAYVFQRPARYAAYLLVAWAVGVVGYGVVLGFAAAVLHLAEWSLAFGAPDARLHALFAGVGRAGDEAPAALHRAWFGVVAAVVHGWAYAYFWTAAAQIYLLLRRDVDGTPCHDVYQPEHDADPFAPEPAPHPATPVTPEIPAAPDPAPEGAGPEGPGIDRESPI